ncbi:hypothetical protein QOT17_016933 [Balamuthia mandrillaris]
MPQRWKKSRSWQAKSFFLNEWITTTLFISVSLYVSVSQKQDEKAKRFLWTRGSKVTEVARTESRRGFPPDALRFAILVEIERLSTITRKALLEPKAEEGREKQQEAKEGASVSTLAFKGFLRASLTSVGRQPHGQCFIHGDNGDQWCVKDSLNDFWPQRYTVTAPIFEVTCR